MAFRTELAERSDAAWNRRATGERLSNPPPGRVPIAAPEGRNREAHSGDQRVSRHFDGMGGPSRAALKRCGLNCGAVRDDFVGCARAPCSASPEALFAIPRIVWNSKPNETANRRWTRSTAMRWAYSRSQGYLLRSIGVKTRRSVAKGRSTDLARRLRGTSHFQRIPVGLKASVGRSMPCSGLGTVAKHVPLIIVGGCGCGCLAWGCAARLTQATPKLGRGGLTRAPAACRPANDRP